MPAGLKVKPGKRVVENYLARYELYSLTPDVSDKTISLIRTYSNTHGLLLADALIAATCLCNDLTLLTYNVSDFQFIAGLKWQRPQV
jgi:predicted nucleic acid-binding protein